MRVELEWGEGREISEVDGEEGIRLLLVATDDDGFAEELWVKDVGADSWAGDV